MATPLPFLFLVLSLALYFPSASSTAHTLYQGSSLSTEKPGDVLTSPNGKFSAGFYSVGINAYCFAIWFNYPSYSTDNRTVVWMANRDEPVNGRRSKLSLLKSGNLILTDAVKFTVWATNIDSSNPFSSVQLDLVDTGNLVLRTLPENVSLWESFDFPTDTLLPLQRLTRNTKLVSSRSQSNYSSGFYKLYFDDDNVLRLLYDGLSISSVFWPDPWLVSWDSERSNYNSSRIAFLDFLGKFSSSDRFTFVSADYGLKLERRLKIDHDGNVRLYSWDAKGEKWLISWQAKSEPCYIHGSCGPNSTCFYTPGTGLKKCSCLPGYEVKNDTDWSYGCEPNFNLSCNDSEADFLHLPHVDFFGNDYGRFLDSTFENCKKLCLELCNCKAFQYFFDTVRGSFTCYPKTLLLHGHRSTSYPGDMYLKMPKSLLSSYEDKLVEEEFELNCTGGVTLLDRKYVKSHVNGTIKFLLWLAYGLGGFQIVCIFLVSCFLFWTQKNSGEDAQVYAVAGFRKFTYAELRKATRNFSEEIGRGAGGIVYKGVLSDHRVAAIKQLNEANQGEGEFLAEVSIIGRLNHMNLIEMWGYCAEGKHRLLVYEYMDHGSLAKNFSSKALDWKKRYEIALGTAKGLAYLHEECLEWVLHCDVKPQNILLDSNYNPKVADFGLSKLQDRGDLNNSRFSRMRGTRGYMAPEWVFNLPITSKVDVYSYGIVVLEMVTGKSPTMGVHAMDDNGGTEQRRLVTWVREKKQEEATIASWMGEIIDPVMEGKYDMKKMEILVGVALQCVQENKDARPTMSQVVEILLRHENDDLVHGSMRRCSSLSVKF